MDINQMQYFVEIVKSNGNLTVAADNLFVSQSALSQFIKNFEKQQGVSLFNRKNGRIVSVSESGMPEASRLKVILAIWFSMVNKIVSNIDLLLCKMGEGLAKLIEFQ